MLGYLDEELGEQEYFMGKEPGRADFMISWPLDMISQNGWIDVTRFPKVKAWHERCHARPAWKRGLEKGNGYVLTCFG
jgi:glutathione S-transferase